MFWLDTALLVTLGLGAILGARTGLVWQLARLLGLAVSVYVAIVVNGSVSEFMHEVFLQGADVRLARLLAYILVFAAVYLVIYSLSRLIYQSIVSTPLEPIDRLLGAGLGLVKAAGILALVCWALASLQHPKTQETLERSFLAPTLANTVDMALHCIPPGVKEDLNEGLENLKELARGKRG
jgi:membrane protein required for colicin V production